MNSHKVKSALTNSSGILPQRSSDVEFSHSCALNASYDSARTYHRTSTTMTHPRPNLFVAFLSSCLLLSIGCRSEKSSVATEILTTQQLETVERIGSQATNTLEENLGKQLKAALQSGAPENALQVCQQVAQPLTVKTSESLPKATVTRTALRFRNEANAPSEEDRAILSEWETLLANGTELPPSKIVSPPPNQAVYYKPILTKPICLTCHGDPSGFSPELTETLTKSYPKDTATHFAEGDLRGAFRVVIDLD